MAIKGPKSPNQLMGHKEFNPKKVNSLMNDLTVNYVFKELIKFYKTVMTSLSILIVAHIRKTTRELS